VRLVLWDIDLTLISTRGMGRLVYQRVFPAVTGVPMRDLAALSGGRTEIETARDTLAMNGLPVTDDLVAALLAALEDAFEAARSEMAARGVVLPGALEALSALATEPTLRQSVLTGNTRAVAAIKLETFGLEPYLDLALGAYGDDHADRRALVGIARERAADVLGCPLDPAEILLVGDTPNDIAAAHAAGTQLITVATGSHSVAQLRAAGAVTVLNSLTEFGAALGALAAAGAAVPMGPAGAGVA
jgi:phosphoglycolate phosphatase-like HAD superfamily hydrolase